jgi:chromosome segregation ATPase
MTKAMDGEVRYFPESSRPLLGRLASTVATLEASDKSSPASFDVSGPLTRIQNTRNFIEACEYRIRELDELLSNSEDREANTAAQLSRAQQQIVDLEQALAAETDRAVRAETLAERVTRRAEELDIACSDAHQKLETLATALEGSFQDLPDLVGEDRAAA